MKNTYDVYVDAPIVTVDLAKTHHLDVFSTYQLTCAAIGNPLPNISFFSTATSPIDINNTITEVSAQEISVTLTIPGYNTSNGAYWCSIANELGNVNSTMAIVNVAGKHNIKVLSCFLLLNFLLL